VRDRAARLEIARDELVALRGLIDSLTFVYQPEAYGPEDGQVYVVRRGAIRAELPAPRSAHERAAIREQAAALFRRREQAVNRVRPTQVAETLLLARWFRLRPAELQRVWPDVPEGARPRTAAGVL